MPRVSRADRSPMNQPAMNPYSAPKPLAAPDSSIPRFRFLVTVLAAFMAYHFATELVPMSVNAARLWRIQNPVGLSLNILLCGTVSFTAWAEWRGTVLTLRTVILACALLVFMTALVTYRFVFAILPFLSLDTLALYRDVIMGQAFYVVAWIYSAHVFLRHRIIRQHSRGTVPPTGATDDVRFEINA